MLRKGERVALKEEKEGGAYGSTLSLGRDLVFALALVFSPIPTLSYL